MASKLVAIATALTVVQFLTGGLFFLQSKDPMLLIFAFMGSTLLWVIVLVVHLLRHGIPVRLVDETKK